MPFSGLRTCLKISRQLTAHVYSTFKVTRLTQIRVYAYFSSRAAITSHVILNLGSHSSLSYAPLKFYMCHRVHGWSVLYFSIFKILHKDLCRPSDFVFNIYLLHNFESNKERGRRSWWRIVAQPQNASDCTWRESRKRWI